MSGTESPDFDRLAEGREILHEARADRDEIKRLRAALAKTQIGVNHIATYRTAKWTDYGTDHEVALEALGAGREYDMWCCWNATMTARDELAQPLI